MKLDKQLTHEEMLKRARSKKPYLYSVYIGDSHPYDEDVLVSCVLLREIEGIRINLKTEEWEFMVSGYGEDDGEILYTDLKKAREAVKKWAVWWQYNDDKALVGWNKSQKEMNQQHEKLKLRLEKENKERH